MRERSIEPGLVTIAITTHDRCELLRRALASALAQTYPNLEIVVSDDASSDGTYEFMASVSDPRVRYWRLEQPTGIAGNFQNGLDHAHGELFMILNDDDELESDAIEKLADCFWNPKHGVDLSKVVLSWCPCKIQDENRKVTHVSGGGPAVEAAIDLVVGHNNGTRGPRFCGILLRTELAVAVGYSREHGGIPDLGNWMRVAARGGFACCIAEPVARYTAHHKSCTGTSSPEERRRAGEVVVRDVVQDLRRQGDNVKIRKILGSKRNLITSLLAAIIIQSMGTPGWRLRAARGSAPHILNADDFPTPAS